METLNEVREYLNTIPFINKGGCGIAALAMTKWLINNKEIEPTIVCYYRDNKHRANNRDFIVTKSDIKLEAPYHVKIDYLNFLMDSSSIAILHEFDDKLIVNKEQLVTIINKAHNWNNQFEKSHINEIEQRLKITLEEIY